MLHERFGSRQRKPDTEAEAVAYVVCQSVGLESGSASADYVQLHDGKKDTLLASLERIRATAAEITHRLLGQDHGVAPADASPLPATRTFGHGIEVA